MDDHQTASNSPAAPHRDAEAFDQVHARFLGMFPELVAELGGDPAELMRQVGIGGANGEGAAALTYREVAALLDLAAASLGCKDFGMRLATRQSGDAIYGPLGEVMRNSPSFGDALGYVSSHAYAHSLAARIWLKRFSEGRLVFVGHDLLTGHMPGRSQLMEQILLVGNLGARQLTGGRARARRVLFRHQPISPLGVYRRHFGCDVAFGQIDDGMVFSAADLASPVIAPDRQAYASATAYIEATFTRHRPPLHAEARGIIMRLLASGDCANERVAAELFLHPRTLHRRLREEGTSFQQVKNEVRADLMRYYIEQTGLEFAAISERLGFAEQSVLTRQCNRWFGLSPTRMRALSGQEAGS